MQHWVPGPADASPPVVVVVRPSALSQQFPITTGKHGHQREVISVWASNCKPVPLLLSEKGQVCCWDYAKAEVKDFSMSLAMSDTNRATQYPSRLACSPSPELTYSRLLLHSKLAVDLVTLHLLHEESIPSAFDHEGWMSAETNHFTDLNGGPLLRICLH